MKKFYAILALVVLVPAYAIGQSTADSETSAAADAALAAPVPANQQATKEQLMKMIEVMHLRDQMQGMMKMMPQVIQQSLQQQWQQMNSKYGTGLTPDQQAALQKLMEKYMAQAMNTYNVDEMIADVIPIYQRHFTREDVEGLIEFYSKPAGQHLLALTPVIMKEYMPVVMKHSQESTAKLTDDMMNDMMAYIKANTPPQTPATK
jgi:hypothetical protein